MGASLFSSFLIAGITMRFAPVSHSRPHPSNGFTLIEIVLVLVLLGLLAATATPKFVDLSYGSKRLAAEAALAEAQVRINAKYSRLLYAGFQCEDAVKAINTPALIADKVTEAGAVFGSFVMTPAEKTITEDGLEISASMVGDSDTVYKPGKLYVPSCIVYEVPGKDDSPLEPDLPGDSGGDSSSDKDGSATGSGEDPSGDGADSGNSGTEAKGDETDTPSQGGNSSGGHGSDLATALQGLEVFNWASAEGTITLPTGRLVKYQGKYYVTTMTAVIDPTVNMPVGDSALTGYFVEVDASSVATLLNCAIATPCPPGMLYQSADSGIVYAYVGNVDWMGTVTPKTDSQWVALV